MHSCFRPYEYGKIIDLQLNERKKSLRFNHSRETSAGPFSLKNRPPFPPEM